VSCSRRIPCRPARGVDFRPWIGSLPQSASLDVQAASSGSRSTVSMVPARRCSPRNWRTSCGGRASWCCALRSTVSTTRLRSAVVVGVAHRKGSAWTPTTTARCVVCCSTPWRTEATVGSFGASTTCIPNSQSLRSLRPRTMWKYSCSMGSPCIAPNCVTSGTSRCSWKSSSVFRSRAVRTAGTGTPTPRLRRTIATSKANVTTSPPASPATTPRGSSTTMTSPTPTSSRQPTHGRVTSGHVAGIRRTCQAWLWAPQATGTHGRCPHVPTAVCAPAISCDTANGGVTHDRRADP